MILIKTYSAYDNVCSLHSETVRICVVTALAVQLYLRIIVEVPKNF